MLFLKLVRKFFKIINSAASPGQIFAGALLGTLFGFLPFFDLDHGLAPTGAAVLLCALCFAVHLGSFLLFAGIGALLLFAFEGLAVALGNGLEGFAQWASRVDLLHASRLSHTGWLGATLIALVVAPLLALAMWRLTVVFRERWQEKLLARRRMILAGKTATNGWLIRVTCWFFGL